MPIEERRFPDVASAAAVLAENLASDLKQALSLRERATLAVSGGRTPRFVFEHLRRQTLDWRRVDITLSDERWVSPGHADSNEGLVRRYLLQGPASAATFIPLYGGEDTPAQGQPACEARLRALGRPIDAVYLGMGDDGHFASLFPGDPAVDARDTLCVAVAATPNRQARMSLTAPAILNAGNIYLLFSGADKHARFAEALTAGSAGEIPLRLLLLQEKKTIQVLKIP